MTTFTFIAADERETQLSLREAAAEARGLAGALRAQIPAGAVVGVMLKSEPRLVTTWLACLHAGLRPLIMQYPTKKQTFKYWSHSVAHTIERGGVEAVLSDEYCLSLGLARMTRAFETPVGTEGPTAGEAAEGAVLPERFSIMQLSSGTTGFRKAVEFHSQDLRRHVQDYNQTLRLDPSTDRIASWLPLYHDMGYIACFVMPILLGVDVVMMDPMDWVRSPVLLFDAVARHRATVVYMPNFGFELMTRCPPRDMSVVRRWISCSEPVSARTSRRFLSHVGAPESAFSACYAMAENIFAVSLSEGMHTCLRDGQEIVSCGAAIAHVEIKLLDDEIWVRSPTSLRNYVGGDDLRDGEGFYPTGDLGWLQDGELYVAGRKADLITQAGRKFMLSDIDLAVNEAFPEVKGRAAAVAQYDERLGTQKPLVLIEAQDFFARDEGAAVAEAVRERTGVDQIEVAFVPPRFLTKTSSGKINRKTSAADWELAQRARQEETEEAVSVTDQLRREFGRLDWTAPARAALDSLSLVVLRIILADAGATLLPGDTLASVAQRADSRSEPAKDGEHIYIVSLADSGTLKQLRLPHLEKLSERLGAPVVFEHVCLPPSAVLLSDLVFQKYFLPRVDRTPYAMVERQLDKLRRASLILVDDVAEMVFPPDQVYGALSHSFQRDPRADLLSVRWQRYPQRHDELPLTVVSGADLPLSQRTAMLERLGAYLGVPIFRIASLKCTSDLTKDWDLRLHEDSAAGDVQRLVVDPDALVDRLAERLTGGVRKRAGTAATRLEVSDLAHFCSRIADSAQIDEVLDAFDRFCIVGQKSSLPYVAKRIEALGKSYVRALSFAPGALNAMQDDFDCVLMCGAQGHYAVAKPAAALMRSGPGPRTWNLADKQLDGRHFDVPAASAPKSGSDWFAPFEMRRDHDLNLVLAARTEIHNIALENRRRLLGEHNLRLKRNSPNVSAVKRGSIRLAESQNSSPVDSHEIVLRLAISLFRTDASIEKKAPEERKSAWAAAKAGYVKRARVLYRVLKQDGIALNAVDTAAV